MSNFKKIHIGSLIKRRVNKCGIEMSRICNYFKCDESGIQEMFQSENLNSDVLLKWSKLLKYDFFRIYSQHLILYSPPSLNPYKPQNEDEITIRKSLYTKELIEFILEQIESGTKSINQVMDDYRIPKSTLYRWIVKYKK